MAEGDAPRAKGDALTARWRRALGRGRRAQGTLETRLPERERRKGAWGDAPGAEGAALGTS